MSPKDIRYNYIFFKPTEKEISHPEYLPYSKEYNNTTNSIRENIFSTDDFSQKSTFFNPGGHPIDSFPKKGIIVEVEDFIALE